MRILLVEDDKIIGDGVHQGLVLDGYAVDWVETRRAAEAALHTSTHEFLILDLGLPDGSGLDILRALRADKNSSDNLAEPIRELTQALNEHKKEGASALPSDKFPGEMRALVAAVNTILDREKQRLEHERAFSAEASHQLRTPLAGIRLQTQIAQRVDDPEKRTKALDKIIIAIDRSAHLVEQLLSYSRLSNFYSSSAPPLIDLVDESKALLNELSERAQGNNLVYEQAIPPSLPPTPCEPQHLNLLLKNLVGNAINYTPENGQVMVKIEPEENAVRLSVQDSGPGIPIEDQVRLQSPFQTASSGKKQSTGLGLAIARRIADIYETSLEASEEALALIQRSETAPDLVITDNTLADGGNGLDVVNDLRSALDKPVPAIMLTGSTEASLRDRALNTVQQILYKPVDADALLKEIRALV